jgi:hypothetical protein
MVITHWTFWELPHSQFTYTQAPNLCISIKERRRCRVWIQLRGACSLSVSLYLPAALFKRSPSNIYNTIASSCEIKYTFIRHRVAPPELTRAAWWKTWLRLLTKKAANDGGRAGIDKRFARHARFIAAGEIYFAIELN